MVSEFNRTLLGINPGGIANPKLLTDDVVGWLTHALREELDEMTAAQDAEDLSGCVDALIDLIYFAIGGMIRMGLSDDQIKLCFSAVHQANMKKRLGTKPTRAGYGDTPDAIKPDGFNSPEQLILDILS